MSISNPKPSLTSSIASGIFESSMRTNGAQQEGAFNQLPQEIFDQILSQVFVSSYYVPQETLRGLHPLGLHPLGILATSSAISKSAIKVLYSNSTFSYFLPNHPETLAPIELIQNLIMTIRLHDITSVCNIGNSFYEFANAKIPRKQCTIRFLQCDDCCFYLVRMPLLKNLQMLTSFETLIILIYPIWQTRLDNDLELGQSDQIITNRMKEYFEPMMGPSILSVVKVNANDYFGSHKLVFYPRKRLAERTHTKEDESIGLHRLAIEEQDNP